MGFEAGATVGPYGILGKLGEGGMGEVYRARDSRLGRDVALKVLPDSLAADPERVARFEREAQILAALSHPSIATIHGLEISGGVRVLVMELVAGESLEARLKRGPLPPDDALAIAKQIGEALAAAHDRGIVHRDLKPGNVMLTPDGGVKVLDFGLARIVEPDAGNSSLSMSPTLSIQATMAGTILGTAPYMSPEQARGRTVDKRTDVWAFGCVLFEMLTGTRAFNGDDLTETVATIVKGDADWAALESVAPPHIVSVVRGCLMKDPKQRFGDIAVPLHLLGAPATTAAAPAAASRANGRTLAIVGVAAALVAAVVTTGIAWKMRPAPAAQPLVRFAAMLASGQNFTNLGRPVVAVSPDGSRIAYLANERLYLRRLSDTEPQRLDNVEDPGGIVNPVFSPDGRQLVFFAPFDATIRTVVIDGGRPVTVAKLANTVSGIQWDETGILYAVNSDGGGIFRIAPDGGNPQKLVDRAADELLSAPAALPGGRGILFSAKKVEETWENGTIAVQTPAGERRVILRGGSDGRYDGNGHLLYASAGVVMAVLFDLDRLATQGTAVPVIEGVNRFVSGTVSGMAQYSLAANGTLAYVPGPVRTPGDGEQRLAIWDDKGTIEPVTAPLGMYRSPRLSRSGRTVAFESGGRNDWNVWLQELVPNTAGRRLTFGGQNRDPVWSPDDLWIAFQSDRDGDVAIFRQRADGTGTAERLTKPAAGTSHIPFSWSPDGATLLFGAEKDGRFELDTLSLKDGSTQRFSQVTSVIPPEAAFSPDGHWVVYQRNDKRAPDGTEAFVEPFPATGAKFLVPVSPVAGHPYWARRGDRLFFNTSSTANVFVTVATSPTVTFSPPQPFPRSRRNEPNPATGRRNVDALPDGRVLGVMIEVGAQAAGGSSDRLMVVLNWAQEVARLSH